MSRRRGRARRGRSYGGSPSKAPAVSRVEPTENRDPKATVGLQTIPQKQTVAPSLGNGTQSRPIVASKAVSGYGERLPSPELTRQNLADLTQSLLDGAWVIPQRLKTALPAMLIEMITAKLPNNASRGNGDDYRYSPRIRMMAEKLLVTLERQNVERVAIATRANASNVAVQVNVGLPDAVKAIEESRRTRVISDDDL